MYADFAELIRRTFGWDIPMLSLFKTFGFLMALSFFAAAYTLYLELKRREKIGLLFSSIRDVQYGKKVSIQSYIINGLIGALIGYKFLGMLQNYKTAAPDPMHFLSNSQGSILGAVIGMALAIYFKYDSYKQFANNGVEEIKKEKVPPYQRVGDIAVVAAVFGFLGAKLFSALEEWNDFIQDPIRNLISSSGLTFYGGLILATAALFYFSKKWNINFKQMCDAAAPGLILAYGIGRLGCQVSGDGDWGIFNTAYVTNIEGKAVPAQDSLAFQQAQAQYPNYFNDHFYTQGFKEVPSKSILRPKFLSFLPHAFFAYSYSHNVNNVGINLNDCKGDYCKTLPTPVFPTPLYEFLGCLVIFTILWKLRKRLSAKPLDLFAVYLVLNGIERYTIEQIRVNNKINLGFWQPTQAELIALGILFTGILMFSINRFMPKKQLITQE